jgi:hypothetical protein
LNFHFRIFEGAGRSLGVAARRRRAVPRGISHFRISLWIGVFWL